MNRERSDRNLFRKHLGNKKSIGLQALVGGAPSLPSPGPANDIQHNIYSTLVYMFSLSKSYTVLIRLAVDLFYLTGCLFYLDLIQ